MMNVLMGIKLNSDFVVRQYKILLVSAALLNRQPFSHGSHVEHLRLEYAGNKLVPLTKK